MDFSVRCAFVGIATCAFNRPKAMNAVSKNLAHQVQKMGGHE